MASLLFAGECMLELRESSANHYRRSFAGDSFNSAVYAKWFDPSLDVELFTAIGKDRLSEEMKTFWSSFDLGSSNVYLSDELIPGVYLINVDPDGERKFTYWRSNSSARAIMKLMGDVDRQSLVRSEFDCVYFSGISMCILEDNDKEKFVALLKELKANGSKIAYDPNYRPRMWRNRAHAQHWNDISYSIADIVLPGIEDHCELYGHFTISQIVEYLNTFEGERECIIKAGDDGIHVYLNDEYHSAYPLQPAATQLDSTAAGDSFAGTYLASRFSGKDISLSVKNAQTVARFVVQQPGAIAPYDEYNKVVKVI